MKHLILFAAVIFCLSSTVKAFNPSEVNDKVLHTFHQIFKNAEDVTWKSSEKLNEASFVQGAIRTKAIINNKGDLVQTIRYYKEENLPTNILYSVKKAYTEEEIWGVTEVSKDSGVHYFITLKNDKNWYNIYVDQNGDISLKSKFINGDK